jgi:hypothetical protein
MNATRTALAALLALAACSNPFDTDWERRIGDIMVSADPRAPSSLQVPDTVQAGASFTARVITYGSSSCTRADGADVRVQGSVAEITPYDLHATGNAVCTADLAPFSREVQLRFGAPGTATVRVLGRPVQGAPPQVVERTVVVR